MKDFKPETTYFSMDDGMRCAYVIYEANEEVQFLEINEPLIRTMGALVYDYPALTWEDMVSGSSLSYYHGLSVLRAARCCPRAPYDIDLTAPQQRTRKEAAQ